MSPQALLCRRTLAFFAAAILTVFSFSCKKDSLTNVAEESDTTAPSVSIIRPVANGVCSRTDTIIVSASDNKGVTKVEVYIDGSIGATANSGPWAFLWNTENSADGSHTLFAKAYDQAGNVKQSTSVSVTVRNSFSAIFKNYLFTDLKVTVGGTTRTIVQGDSTVFVIRPIPSSVSYSAETAGYTIGGTQVGLRLTWSYTIDVSSASSLRVAPTVSSDVFFMYIRNTGGTTLGPVYVNYGLSDQTRDNITIPNDGLNHLTGYYYAHTNTQVRAIWANGSQYSYWNQGTHFSLPFSSNQSVTLLNNLPKAATEGGSIPGTGTVTTSPPQYCRIDFPSGVSR